ncbi:acyltransferase [Pedobacter glucosidilyticus]|uniref:acyltransferase n=1 Tax=Pedobacter glucosidilyticus TaxID=1122941 RepID=UPI000685D4AC|nr:acyltransferase [Pedobacter glucosidilyticus]
MKFQIGKKSFINLGCKFNCKGNFYLGDFSVINQGSHLDNRGIIFIGNNVSIGPQVKIITADHDLFSENCVGRQKKIEIDDYVFIGYNATLIGNAKMSKGSALGASSLLNRPVEPYCLFVGNPAVKKKIRPSNLNYKMDYNRLFQ